MAERRFSVRRGAPSPDAMVDRYTNWTAQTDFPDGFADCGALRRSRRTGRTVCITFAKVRVASSNLVIRSQEAGQRPFTGR